VITLIKSSNIRLKAVTPTRITAFLGLNKSEEGDTELKLGEASETQNFRVTSGYEIKKMEGWQPLFDSIGQEEVNEMWAGKLNGINMLVFKHGSKLYKRVDGVNTELGDIAEDGADVFYFNSKLYILDGEKYREFDGTTYKEVEGYRPIVSKNGTPYEQANLLTGAKACQQTTNVSTTRYDIPEKQVDSIDYVKIDGATQTNYNANAVNGFVSFDSAPANDGSIIEIGWTKKSEENHISKCTHAFIYGGSSDTRIFVYGNPDAPNREYFSGVAVTPRADYFPANNYKDIGSNQYPITDMARQYNTQLIYKKDETFYANIETSTDALGFLNTDFPALPLNSEKGNIAVGQTRVLLNNPVSICRDGIYMWTSSNVRDERNTSKISQRLGREFEALDLSKVITFDWEDKMEYWISVPEKKMCYIYNYGNDTWYTRTNVEAYSFAVIDRELYFGSKGTINKFSEDYRYDGNFETIDAVYVTGFYGFGKEWLKKNIRKMWSSVKPESKVYVQYSYTTDNQDETIIGEIKYDVIDFAHIDFSKFAFNTSLTVKPFRFKMKAKKFAYFKLKIKSDKNVERATVLNVELKETEGGEIK
jgi:hypothetical protein